MRNYDSKHQIGAGTTAAAVLLLAILLLSVQVQNVMVTGSDRYSTKQMKELLSTSRWGKNSAHAYFSGRFRPHIRIPFVEDYKAVFHNPLDVEMVIHEKNIVGYVSYMSNFMYFDKDGIVVKSSESQLPGVPRIAGMEFDRIVLHRLLPVDGKNIFEEILNLIQQLSVYDIAVDCTQYDSHGQAALFTGMVGITVGDHMDTGGKIPALNDILKAQPQPMETSGTMRPDNCSESNSGARTTSEKR